MYIHDITVFEFLSNTCMHTHSINVMHTLKMYKRHQYMPCLAFVNMPRILSIMYVVYIIILTGSCPQGGEEWLAWPGDDGHVLRGADPSSCQLVLYEILSTLAFIVENKLFIMWWWYNTFIWASRVVARVFIHAQVIITIFCSPLITEIVEDLVELNSWSLSHACWTHAKR